MKLLRILLSFVAIVTLTGGYLASQVAAFQGPQSQFEYAQRADMPAVRYLALLLLSAAIVLCFVPEREEQQ